MDNSLYIFMSIFCTAQTLPNDISTLEGAFEVIELEARAAFGELTVGAGTQVLIFVN
jgi:hypothetical protein